VMNRHEQSQSVSSGVADTDSIERVWLTPGALHANADLDEIRYSRKVRCSWTVSGCSLPTITALGAECSLLLQGLKVATYVTRRLRTQCSLPRRDQLQRPPRGGWPRQRHHLHNVTPPRVGSATGSRAYCNSPEQCHSRPAYCFTRIGMLLSASGDAPRLD